MTEQRPLPKGFSRWRDVLAKRADIGTPADRLRAFHEGRTQITANATLSEGWWAVKVSSIDGLFTQAQFLGDIPAAVVDAAHLLGVEITTSDVCVKTVP